MAGDWMKIEKTTPEKPEVFAIASIMNIDPDAVVGKLFRVWRWFDDHTRDGNASCVSISLLDRCAGVPGFAKAMQAVGWMTETETGVSLPNFGRHNGETSKQRALTAKRVSAYKKRSNAGGNAEGNDGGNGRVTEDARPREEKRSTEYLPPEPPKGGRRRRMTKSERRIEELNKAITRQKPKENEHAAE